MSDKALYCVNKAIPSIAKYIFNEGVSSKDHEAIHGAVSSTLASEFEGPRYVYSSGEWNGVFRELAQYETILTKVFIRAVAIYEEQGEVGIRKMLQLSQNAKNPAVKRVYRTVAILLLEKLNGE